MSDSPIFDALSQRDLLQLIDADPQPRNQEQTEAIKAAILADGREHAGSINPNRVRAALRDVPLFHKRIGPAYHALRSAGLITYDGVLLSDDKQGRNAGRPIRSYRLTEQGWAA